MKYEHGYYTIAVVVIIAFLALSEPEHSDDVQYGEDTSEEVQLPRYFMPRSLHWLKRYLAG